MKPDATQIGTTWYHVCGEGPETAGEAVQLYWIRYSVQKQTPCGVWLQRLFGDSLIGKPKFALLRGCRWAAPSEEEALRQLVRRKKAHLRILASQQYIAVETLRLATQALKETTDAES